MKVLEWIWHAVLLNQYQDILRLGDSNAKFLKNQELFNIFKDIFKKQFKINFYDVELFNKLGYVGNAINFPLYIQPLKQEEDIEKIDAVKLTDDVKDLSNELRIISSEIVCKKVKSEYSSFQIDKEYIIVIDKKPILNINFHEKCGIFNSHGSYLKSVCFSQIVVYDSLKHADFVNVELTDLNKTETSCDAKVPQLLKDLYERVNEEYAKRGFTVLPSED